MSDGQNSNHHADADESQSTSTPERQEQEASAAADPADDHRPGDRDAGAIRPAPVAAALMQPHAASAAAPSVGVDASAAQSSQTAALVPTASALHPTPTAGSNSSAQLAFAAAASQSSLPATDPGAAAVRTTPQPPSPMLRCLTKCRDVQFVLMQMLRLEDLAALNGTCHQWRQWLLHPPLVDGLQFRRAGTLLQLESLAQSDWARQMVTSVVVKLEGSEGNWTLLLREDGDPTERKAYGRLLVLLPRFTRLHVLKLHVCGAFDPSAQGWSTCLTALAGSLQSLNLVLCHSHQAGALNSALAHVSVLQQLQSLSILVLSSRNARHLDLSQLPLLPRLRGFAFGKSRPKNCRPFFFRCTPAQVQHLAQCRQLTHFHCGVWSPDEREDQVDHEGWQLLAADQQIADGIGALVRGLTSAHEPAADSSSSSTGAADRVPTPPCALRHFSLDRTVMSAAVWEHASQLVSLKELKPKCWCSDLTPEQWTRLADFQRLRSIRIVTHPVDDDSSGPLRTAHFLPSLLQCVQLTSVTLAGSSLSLSSAQLDGLARLRRLHELELHALELPSAAPLTAACKLKKLRLSFCRGPPAVVDFRSSLPPMRSLTSLKLEDRCRITAEQAAPLNAALFGRMPKLTPSGFTQNLLA